MTAMTVPLRAMLGLGTRRCDDIYEIQSLQIDGARGFVALRCAALAFMGFLATLPMIGLLPLWLIAGWNIANGVMTALWYGVLKKVDVQGPIHPRTTQNLIKTIQLNGLLMAAIWSLPFVAIHYFMPEGLPGLFALLSVWAITVVAMVGMAMGLSTLPMVAVPYILAVSVSSATIFLFRGHYTMVAGSGLIAISLLFAVVRHCRSHLLQHRFASSLQEKSETVSLLLREFEDTGADWLWQTDTARCVVHVSPRFAVALGQEPTELEGQPILKLMAGDSWETGQYSTELHELSDKLKRRESFSNLVIPVLRDGQMTWWELSASPRLSDDGDFLGFRGVGSDVTEQWESAEKISQLARFDTLTKLPNRLRVTEALKDAMEQSEQYNRRCAFMMIDLDRFKQVNDTLGHPVGDRLLAQVSRRLQSLMSDDEVCGRLGGDEFAVVIADISDGSYVSRLADNIIARLSQPYDVDQHTLYIGASIGSAIGPRDGRSVEMLMRSADLALYRSKEDGRGVHNSYKPQLHAQAEERRLMEIELRNALKNEEFNAVYQPVVDANEGSLVGFEALMRWNNERFGAVSPAKFIPLAEDARMIVPMGEWILRRACYDAMKWPSQVKVAVNVSAEQLTHSGFVDSVSAALRDSGLPAQRLEIEVTESLFVRDGGMATQVLDQILALGIKLSLDDFGTGYSSLGYLRKTRFNTIKVDRSFVKGAANNVAESIAIIRAVVAMADSLGMSTTAEGVETEQELEMVRALGAKKIQGFFFGRPMPFEDTLPLFAPNLSADERDLYRDVQLGAA